MHVRLDISGEVQLCDSGDRANCPLPYSTLPCPTPTLSCLTLSCPALPCPALPFLTLSYPTLLCLGLSFLLCTQYSPLPFLSSRSRKTLLLLSMNRIHSLLFLLLSFPPPLSPSLSRPPSSSPPPSLSPPPHLFPPSTLFLTSLPLKSSSSPSLSPFPHLRLTSSHSPPLLYRVSAMHHGGRPQTAIGNHLL
jgi:hypothetical protein